VIAIGERALLGSMQARTAERGVRSRSSRDVERAARHQRLAAAHSAPVFTACSRTDAICEAEKWDAVTYGGEALKIAASGRRRTSSSRFCKPTR